MENSSNSSEKNQIKRPTNRDVARLAGVSIATVSYVINGKEEQHISEETKKKVYHAINFLNYVPNPHAVGLNSDQQPSIVLRSSPNASLLTENEIIFFMHSLEEVCKKRGYLLSYSMDKRAVKIAASACVCFDMPNAYFHELSGENYIPVIAVNCLVNDPVFYQVNIDFSKVDRAAQLHFGGEDYTYCCIKPENAELEDYVRSQFSKIRFVSSYDDVNSCIAQEKNIVLTQPALFTIFKNNGRQDALFYDKHIPLRAQTVIDCINKAIDRLNIADEEHYILV